MKAEGLRIEYVNLSELVPADDNPKLHEIELIIDSYRRFGFITPGVINEKTGKLVAGHGRAEALQKMKDDGEKRPKNIKARGRAWFVPFVRGHSFKDDAEAEAFLLADNRLTEVGGWDHAQLAVFLQRFAEKGSLDGTGYSEADLDDLVAFSDPDGLFKRPDHKALVDEMTDVEIKGSEKNQRWFYVEFYSPKEEKRFNELTAALEGHTISTSKHQIDPDLFYAAIMEYVERNPPPDVE